VKNVNIDYIEETFKNVIRYGRIRLNEVGIDVEKSNPLLSFQHGCNILQNRSLNISIQL
jgi:hypothetical protein